jgi:hypothetical protein
MGRGRAGGAKAELGNSLCSGPPARRRHQIENLDRGVGKAKKRLPWNGWAHGDQRHHGRLMPSSPAHLFFPPASPYPFYLNPHS